MAYRPTAGTTWPRKLVSGNGCAVFQIQDDGNLVLYHDDAPVWATNTGTITPNPLPTERTRGDFLFPYFGPAYMSYPSMGERTAQFDAQRAAGATDILIMAQWVFRARYAANGWAGPAEFDFRANAPALEDLVATIQAIRDRDMRVSVMAWDRGSGGGIGDLVDDIVDAVRQLHEATAGLVETIAPAFEIDEGGFSEGDQVDLFRRLHTAAPGVRLAAHYNRVPEDADHWRRMRDVGCTDLWVQHGRSDTLLRLAIDTQRWIEMLPREVAYTCFEHSAPAKNSQHSPAERDACRDIMRAQGRPLHSFNSTSP